MPKPRLTIVPPKAADPNAAPSWLSSASREVWGRVAPVLAARGTLTDETRDALSTYCSNVGLVRECDEVIAREGMTLTGPGGMSRPHPLLSVKVRAAAIVLQLAKRLRLLDAAAKASGSAAKVHDDFADLDL